MIAHKLCALAASVITALAFNASASDVVTVSKGCGMTAPQDTGNRSVRSRVCAPHTEIAVAAAVAHLNARASTLGLGKGGQLHAYSSYSFAGDTYTRFEQRLAGVRVWGAEVVVKTDARGDSKTVGSSLVRGIDTNISPLLTAEEAISTTTVSDKDALKVDRSYAELVVFPRYRRAQLEESDSGRVEGGTATDYKYVAEGANLAYHVTVVRMLAGVPMTERHLVDARDGTLLLSFSADDAAAATGLGRSFHNGQVWLSTNSVNGHYRLQDPTRGGQGGNETVNDELKVTEMFSGEPTLPLGEPYVDTDNDWGNGQAFDVWRDDQAAPVDPASCQPPPPSQQKVCNEDGPDGHSKCPPLAPVEDTPDPMPSTVDAYGQTSAVDVHFGVQRTWDMYKNVFGRNGWDGLGSRVVAHVHWGLVHANAMFSPETEELYFGDGMGSGPNIEECSGLVHHVPYQTPWKPLPYTTLDTVGHEFNHAVVHSVVDLVGPEGPALKEGFADIFGEMAEFYSGGTNGSGLSIPNEGADWIVGGGLRRFETQKISSWSPTLQSEDRYEASGPLRRAFYLLSRGASSTQGSATYSPILPLGSPGIGNDRAAKVLYASVLQLTSMANYAEVRTAAIAAASSLYGNGSTVEKAVWNAFAAINVGPTWNSMHAPFESEPNDSAESADLIGPSSLTRAVIGPGTFHRTDYFRFTLAANSGVFVTAASGNANTDAYVYNAEKGPAATYAIGSLEAYAVDDSPTPKPMYVSNFGGTTPKVFFIKVQSPDIAPDANYELQIKPIVYGGSDFW